MILAWRFLVSFLIGSIPFAKVAMLGTGVDITKVGSKNPGFNNVLRVSSKWRAAIALTGDISKGYIAILLLSPAEPSWVLGIAAVMGHCWSPFLRFNGGKGVATTVGVLLLLEPRITIVCLPLYVVLRIIGKKLHWRQEGAIASLSTMTLISVIVGGLAYVLLAIVVLRHMPNLRDIMASRGAPRSEQPKSQSADVQAARRQSQ
jgi:acyl phosphate:glycerol-3-phosphate acyltransferase